MNTHTAVSVACLVFGITIPLSEARIWTDLTGKHQVEADFVSIDNGAVSLKTTGGKVIKLRLAKLSEADRAIALKLTEKDQPDEESGDIYEKLAKQISTAMADAAAALKLVTSEKSITVAAEKLVEISDHLAAIEKQLQPLEPSGKKIDCDMMVMFDAMSRDLTKVSAALSKLPPDQAAICQNAWLGFNKAMW